MEEENIEVDSKFRALVAIGSLVYLTPLYVNPLNYFSNFLIFFNAAGIFFPLSNISKLIEKGFFFFFK